MRRAISYAHFDKFRMKAGAEQQVWNECSRAIANAIIYSGVKFRLANLPHLPKSGTAL
ncbi:MAG TPA: hypothetical protein VKU19_41150 [Bryobacteraceae bacterium]|nr:hypothetical protein [Bryobacteraceae bacterium]